MKKQFFNYFLASLLLLTGFGFKAVAQNVEVEAKLQQYTIRIGDQTKLFLSVRQGTKEHVNFPKLVDTIIGKVQIVSANKPDTTKDKNDPQNITVVQSYTITSFDAGTYTLPAFEFGTAGGVIKSNQATLQVETVKVDTTKAIYDIKQPLAVSYTFVDWLRDNWYLVVLPLLGILLIAGLIYYYRKRPKTEPVIKVAKPSLPPHQIALARLAELRDKKLWQQDEIKLYHSELSDIIREYLEKRYVIKTHEKTTDEIFAGLKHMSITNENRTKLKQILVLADLVKFAKERPLPPENEQSMNAAIEFVMKTQQAEIVETAVGGTGNV
jgi:hypothetical protein